MTFISVCSWNTHRRFSSLLLFALVYLQTVWAVPTRRDTLPDASPSFWRQQIRSELFTKQCLLYNPGENYLIRFLSYIKPVKQHRIVPRKIGQHMRAMRCSTFACCHKLIKAVLTVQIQGLAMRRGFMPSKITRCLSGTYMTITSISTRTEDVYSNGSWLVENGSICSTCPKSLQKNARDRL